MGFARAADVPVILLGDIDRGGVIASLVGTKAVIDPADAAMIVGFIVNRFRGDPSLFDDGMKLVAQHTGWRALGLVPFFAAALKLPAEDALALPTERGSGRVKIAVLAYPRIANFDDFDPLRLEPDVDLVFVRPGEPVPGDAALVIDHFEERRLGLRHHAVGGGRAAIGVGVADPDLGRGDPRQVGRGGRQRAAPQQQRAQQRTRPSGARNRNGPDQSCHHDSAFRCPPPLANDVCG